ncbi:alpha/beta fold hydrolase [Actinopolymorpha alba]|uniref:alpha/beta fold hydrolase n=1 Tax=Actinopolymorpha alba TaxID=533267 RepID=UPI00037D9A9B|nr:alpha/beta fold hydrolase [Actinopolymorpha alba]
MRRRRSTIGAVAVLTSLASVLLAPGAGASPEFGAAREVGPAPALGAAPDRRAVPSRTAFTVSTVRVDVRVGPDQATRCRVVADLYVPVSATPQTRQPAILTTHGFGGSKEDQAGLAKAFAERNYVVLAYSGLGFGSSQCKVRLDDPDWDGRAASQLVDYLAGERKDVDGGTVDAVALDAPGDPRVGMFGGSYGGQVQFAAASVDDRIDALVPAITWYDLDYALAPTNIDSSGAPTGDSAGTTTAGTPAIADPNTREPGVFKRMWADLFAAAGVLRGAQYALGDPRRLLGCPNFADQICPALIEANLIGYPSPATRELLRHASVASYVSRVKVPTLLLQGQDDTLFNLQEAIATYRALDAQGTPVRMVWQSWGHSGSTPAAGEIDLSGDRAPETTYEGRRVLDWFAYWLRDDRRASLLGPRFSYFRDWIDYDGAAPEGAEPAYGTANAYPVGTTQRLYLSGNKTLTPRRAEVVSGSQTWLNLPGGVPSSYSELPPEMDLIPPYDGAGTYAAWTTPALTSDVETVGVPTLDVRLTSPAAALSQRTGPAGRLVVFAKLYDVSLEGKLTLRHRLVSPVRVADVTKPVRIELPGVVHRWQKGHRIRLVLAASDAVYANNLGVLPVTVKTTLASVPVLELPVVGAGRVPAGS